MKAPHQIYPSAVYDLESARNALGLPKNTLPREIRAGRLKVSKRAGKYFLLGVWILEWLEGGIRDKRKPPASPAVVTNGVCTHDLN